MSLFNIKIYLVSAHLSDRRTTFPKWKVDPEQPPPCHLRTILFLSVQNNKSICTHTVIQWSTFDSGVWNEWETKPSTLPQRLGVRVLFICLFAFMKPENQHPSLLNQLFHVTANVQSWFRKTVAKQTCKCGFERFWVEKKLCGKEEKARGK